MTPRRRRPAFYLRNRGDAFSQSGVCYFVKTVEKVDISGQVVHTAMSKSVKLSCRRDDFVIPTTGELL